MKLTQKKLFEFTKCGDKKIGCVWFKHVKNFNLSRINALKLTSKCAKELNNTKNEKESKLVLTKYKKLAHTLYEESK